MKAKEIYSLKKGERVNHKHYGICIVDGVIADFGVKILPVTKEGKELLSRESGTPLGTPLLESSFRLITSKMSKIKKVKKTEIKPVKKTEKTKITLDEFLKKAVELFGEDKKQWRFKCICCGEVQTIQDFIDLGIEEPETFVHFSCIGRWDKKRGCDWTLGGLFTIHTKEVLNESGTYTPVFEFDE